MEAKSSGLTPCQNPGYAFTPQWTLVRNSTDQDEESIGPRLHPNRNDHLLRVRFFSFLREPRKPRSSCPVTEQHFPLAEPKGRPSRSLPAPCQQPPATPHPLPGITPPLSTLPNNFLPRSRVLFWFTAHLASILEHTGGSCGQGGDVITMKGSNCVGKGPRTLVEKMVIQRGQPSKYQYLDQIQDSRMESKEWCLNVTTVSPLELLGLVLSHPAP